MMRQDRVKERPGSMLSPAGCSCTRSHPVNLSWFDPNAIRTYSDVAERQWLSVALSLRIDRSRCEPHRADRSAATIRAEERFR